MMNQQAVHPMLPRADHDELARQDFVFTLKQFVSDTLAVGSRAFYQGQLRPVLEKRHGRAPNRHEIRRQLASEPHDQMISSMKRTIQEFTWDTTGESVERQLADLIAKAKVTRTRKEQLGSLRLDPDLEIPRYLSAVDIHAMPGNYHTELTEDDVFAGALYDRGVYLFSLGGQGPSQQDFGLSLISFVKDKFPDLKLERILDLGCTVGSSTLQYVEAFPDAEIHAIDVAAPLLRYAHGRAELTGRAIHFSQQNAESTNFEDRTFDLVVSTGLLHETSRKAMPQIMRECFRLLRPGGLMVHGESRQYPDMDPYDAALHDWGTHYNAEPFMTTMHETDLVQVALDAGFKRENTFPQIPVTSRVSQDQAGSTKFRDFVFTGARYFSGAVK